MSQMSRKPGAPDPLDRHVGRRIFQRRRELRLSRRQLGEKIGVGLKQVNKYETGANRVSAGRLYDIAQVLGVPASFFFDGYDGDGTAADQPSDASFQLEESAEIRSLLSVYHTMPQKVRGRFLRLVRAIAQNTKH